MTRNFAPAPFNWQTSRTFDAKGVFNAYLLDANGRKIAAIWGRGEEKIATVHLLAAAPELLAALKEVVGAFVNPHDGGEFEDGEVPAIDRARAAIAKAEGAGE